MTENSKTENVMANQIPEEQVADLQKAFTAFGKAWKLKAVNVVKKPKEDEAE